jgi:hypothetical protein
LTASNELKPKQARNGGAACARLIQPDMMAFNRFAPSAAVFAAVAWLPAPQIGERGRRGRHAHDLISDTLYLVYLLKISSNRSSKISKGIQLL